MYRVVMFDCDGVLIDSETLAGRVHSEMLTALGFTISYDEMVGRFCGVRDDEMYTELERDFGMPLPADYATSAARRIMEEFPRSLTAIAGIDDALARISKVLCVVSSSPPDKLRYGLDLVDLSRFFGQNIFSGWSVERGKPAPDVYFYAARLMNALPEHCLVVEDSIAGVTSGAAAGMTVLGFDGGDHCPSGHADRLLESGARLVFSDMRDLPGIIERIERAS